MKSWRLLAKRERFVHRVTPATETRPRRDSSPTDVVAPNDGSNSEFIAGPTNRSSGFGFLAVSGDPLQWVPCIGRPADPQALHNVTPGAGDLRRPNQVTQRQKEQ